ncbi:MAG: dihydrolipoyl dehydrogenase [Bacillota bacterium]|nr:dihydrolipoyl dehydrogenase [Bacillota bacterium]
MKIDITAKTLPKNAAEAKITKIHKQIGDEVQSGDSLLELEANKASMPIISQARGTITALYVEAGQKVKADDPLCTIEGEEVLDASPKQSSTDDKPSLGYFAGMMKPQKKTVASDLCIIGAGPGGYVAAIKAAQLGCRVVLIEKEHVGGTCLNWGCIPTKCMVRSAEVYTTLQSAEDYGCFADYLRLDMRRVLQRKDEVVTQLRQGIEHLLSENGVTVLSGTAELVDRNTVLSKQSSSETTVTAKKLIIATGSRITNPPIPGAQLKQVINSDIALQLEALPVKMVVVGGGVVGMEFAFIFSSFGVNVSVVEYADQILSNCDPDICAEIYQIAIEKGIKIYRHAMVEAILPAQDDQCVVVFKQDDEVKYLATDMVLMSIGREPVIAGLGFEKLGIELNDNKKGIKVNEHMETSVPGIYAIGDVTNRMLLAHVASHQGIVAVRNIMGESCDMDYTAVPSAIFTEPEIGIVGLNEETARKKGYDITVGKFPVGANGKALAMGESRGFIKIIAEEKSGTILGAAIIGPHASDLIADLTLAVNRKLTLRDIYETIYAHPTTAEIIHEAALGAEGRSLHFVGS